MRKLTHPELVARQEIRRRSARLPFHVILNNIRSLYNVGSIFRTADGAGLEKIWLCGITGIPPDPKISKTALGAEEAVPWEYKKDPVPLIRDLKNQGFQVALLEQTERSIPYEEFVPQGPVCLVVGNEIQGVGEELLHACDAALEIDMTGIKNSLNVTVAFGIVAYQIRQHLKKPVSV